MGLRLNLLLISVIPIVLFGAAMIGVSSLQTGRLSSEITTLIEERIVEDKKTALRNYAELAQSAIRPLVQTDERTADQQEAAKRVLNSMTFGEDGYFYVYDYSGQNLVHPKLTELVGQDLWTMQDPKGNLVIQGLISQAQGGGGYHSYIWNKPSTGTEEPKIGYATGIEPWQWMLGTGLYLDDIRGETALASAAIESTVRRSFFWVLGFGLLAVLLAAVVVYTFQLNLQRSADQKLTALNRRIVDIQEEQSQRISRDLHDGISQLLVLTRYSVEAAESELDLGQTEQRQTLERARSTLDRALLELRSVARALRPPALDQLGLQDALLALSEDFQTQSNLQVHSDIHAMRDRLTDGGKSAFFRVAQEALTNVSKHAQARNLWISLRVQGAKAVLVIEDDGRGIPAQAGAGLGIANMSERLASQGGKLTMGTKGNGQGTRLVGTLPLTTGNN